jgi:hypothetical protein
VSGKDCDRDRDNEPVRRQHGCGRDFGSAQVAEPARLARAPQQNRCAPEEQDAERAEEEPGPVLATGADCPGIRDRKRSTFERQRTEHGRERRAASCGKTRVESDCDREHGERRRTSRQVVTEGCPRLRREERVDGYVQREGCRRSREDEHV